MGAPSPPQLGSSWGCSLLAVPTVGSPIKALCDAIHTLEGPGTPPRAQRAVIPAPAPARQLPGGAGQGCPEAEHPPWAGPGLTPRRHGGRGQRPQAGGRRPHPHLVPGPELRHPPPSGPWEAWPLARDPARQVPLGASGGASPAARTTPQDPGTTGPASVGLSCPTPAPTMTSTDSLGHLGLDLDTTGRRWGVGGTRALPCLGAHHCGFRNPRGSPAPLLLGQSEAGPSGKARSPEHSWCIFIARVRGAQARGLSRTVRSRRTGGALAGPRSLVRCGAHVAGADCRGGGFSLGGRSS